METIQFDSYCRRVQDRIERVYGIPVITRDVPDPLTGDLDGARIEIDFAVTPEQRLFLLAHLFGHTVQWNVNPRSSEIGRPRQPPVDPAMLPDIRDYERQAAAYALTLLHEAGIMALDQWLSDYTACDARYLEHYYVTGEKREFQLFWQDGTAVLEPEPIPPFVPTKQISRNTGIVF